MTLQINFAPQEEAKLRDRAAAAGKDIETFIREAALEKADRPSLAEVLAPIHDDTVKRGITLDQVDDAIRRARAAYRGQRRGANDTTPR